MPNKRTIWIASFGVWAFVSAAETLTIYQLYHHTLHGMTLKTVAGMEFSQILTYAPVTPFAFFLALRFPIQRGNWMQRSFLHLGFGIFFTVGHILIKASAPYGYWDPALRDWTSALWNPKTHAFRLSLTVMKSMFLASVVDDVTGAYASIVLVAHALAYYRSLRTEEVRAAQLEAQLAAARLETLKSQLQPHFLFNTMHSISALMLIDTHAADRMMCRLSDLLRVSLESAGTQITTLRRELEFVNCYLEIEKIRFEERLRVVYHIAPDTLDAEVPHLLLQPLVDNAVKHGISKSAEGGEIVIRSAILDEMLRLEVANTAAASADRTLNNTVGIGLRVTRERLESLYGAEHRFELTISPQNHFVALVCIPFIGGKEAAEDATVDPALLRRG